MVELLSPGGSLDMVQHAVDSGADSVYVGPLGWSRRESRYELQHHEVREAVRMAHDGGSKLRVALNADIESADHGDMLGKVEAYAAWDVDGFIMKTPGAMRVVHDRFPQITIHASVGCNVRNRKRMEQVKEAGATQFVASTALNNFERIAVLKREADEVGIGVELLIHSNRCVTGVGGCRLYDYFEPYFEEEVVHDSDGSHRIKLIGNPDKGGVCYRPCLGTHIPEIAERFPRPVIDYLDKSNNEIYQLLEDIPRYMSLGVTTLKIQGREYPTSVISDLTKLYRKLVDQVEDGRPDVPGARATLDHILPERDQVRSGKTQELHTRLLTRMSEGQEPGQHPKVCYACGAPEEDLHRTSVARAETTDWDPDTEEAILLGDEPGG
ncbi:MAG TPA: peptidase U32 family protein [Actinomycetota bacterium]|jgi:putative protease|nr:peptidase U32 family protein [Actinomycetota bacterium]